MSKWLGLLVLFLVCGAWWLSGGQPGDARAEAAERPILLQPPLGNKVAQGTEPEPSEPVPAPDVQPEGKQAIEADPAKLSQAEPAEPEVASLLDRSAALVASGQRTAARDMLMAGMAATTSPHEQARLGLHLVDLVDAASEQRLLLTRALKLGVVQGDELDGVSRHLGRLNRDPRSSLFDLVPTKAYAVCPNDSLWKLCNQTFPETMGQSPEVGLVKLFNGMTGDSLQVGQTLLVPMADAWIVVDRQQLGLVMYLGDVALVAYRVGLGKEERTPRGEFVVEVKQEEPTWFRNGRAIPFGNPENILGTRWMGFENAPGAMGYGIHGTDAPASIGKNESMGCVRMRNEDVEELFELVARGTRVQIP